MTSPVLAKIGQSWTGEVLDFLQQRSHAWAWGNFNGLIGITPVLPAGYPFRSLSSEKRASMPLSAALRPNSSTSLSTSPSIFSG
jgi:hypothetical protein